ncbi:MAG: hypothetical protein AB1705_08575 [Verrucomicrobiota bacterium]
MSQQLHQNLLQCLTDRAIWEQRQRVWYQMRHDGLRRRNKPFPAAADLHFPLVDTVIEKLKPFYFNQLFNDELLAEFVSLQDQVKDAGDAAAEWMDYKLKQETDLEEEVLSMTDTMLLRGRGILKFYWHADGPQGRLVFESVDPLFIIMPRRAVGFDTTDFFAHIKQLTIGEFRRGPYMQDEALLQMIRGNIEDADAGQNEQERAVREGLTYSNDPDTVIVWEAYEKTSEGWRVRTYSPRKPDVDLRPAHGLPLKFQGKPFLPFVSFVAEVKDKGWYSPRGIAERLGAFEKSLCALWNQKHDTMTFYNKPLFTSGTEIKNTANLRFLPGEILPPGVQPVEMPQPPISFDQEMLNTRAVAEQSIMMPDFGLGDSRAGGKDPKTATEVDYIRSLSATGVDLKGKLFKKAFAKVLRGAWAMLIQHAKDSLTYYSAQSRKVLPLQALHDNYLIAPDASPDQWNRQWKLQRAVGRFQLLKGHPNVDQEELVKSVLAAEDARLVNKLFIPTNARAASEMEDEAVEITLLLGGYPAAVQPGENHELRIRVLLGKLQQLAALGEPVDPIALQRMQQHLALHLQFLAEQNPALAKQITAGLKAVAKAAGLDDGAPVPGGPRVMEEAA